jgi:hypothetical protein
MQPTGRRRSESRQQWFNDSHTQELTQPRSNRRMGEREQFLFLMSRCVIPQPSNSLFLVFSCVILGAAVASEAGQQWFNDSYSKELTQPRSNKRIGEKELFCFDVSLRDTKKQAILLFSFSPV